MRLLTIINLHPLGDHILMLRPIRWRIWNLRTRKACPTCTLVTFFQVQRKMNDWWRYTLEGSYTRYEKIVKNFSAIWTTKWRENEQTKKLKMSGSFTFRSNEFFISSKLLLLFFPSDSVVPAQFSMVLELRSVKFFANFLSSHKGFTLCIMLVGVIAFYLVQVPILSFFFFLQFIRFRELVIFSFFSPSIFSCSCGILSIVRVLMPFTMPHDFYFSFGPRSDGKWE